MPEIKVPVFSESVSEGTLLSWNKKPGDAVTRGDILAEIETDKVVLEVTALQDGVLQSIAKQEGDTVLSEEVLGVLGEAGSAPAPAPAADRESGPIAGEQSAGGTAPSPTATLLPRRRGTPGGTGTLPPAARKIVAENNLDASQIQGTGPKGNITKQDAVLAAQGGGTRSGTAGRRRTRLGAGQRGQSARPGSSPVSARPERPQRAARRAAGADDPHPPAHRRAPQGSAEHRRHPDDLQRGQHAAEHGPAQKVPGSVRRQARRQARLHEPVRAGGHRGAESLSQRERQHRRQGHHLPRLLRHRHRGGLRARTGRADLARHRRAGPGRRGEGHRRICPESQGGQADHGRHVGRHLQHHQRRDVRQHDEHPDHQPAAERHSGHAQHHRAPDCRQMVRSSSPR